MVLNDIIEQAAGQQTGPTDHGGKHHAFIYPQYDPYTTQHHRNALILVRLPRNRTNHKIISSLFGH